MGYSILADIVPFLLEDVFYGDDSYKNAPEIVQKHYIDYVNDKVNGWEKTDDNFIYGKLFVDVIEKDDMKVYSINQAQWANGGALEIAYFADNLEDLEQFKIDQNFSQVITHNQAVKQVL